MESISTCADNADGLAADLKASQPGQREVSLLHARVGRYEVPVPPSSCRRSVLQE
jgi:hypothetical protein